MLFHSDSLITGCVLRKPSWVESVVAQNWRVNKHVRGSRGRTGDFSASGEWWGMRLMVENFTYSDRQWELASCSGAGYGKTSVWGSFAFYSVLKGCKKESESETETERDWFQPGRPLRNFPVILCLTCTMVGGNGNREKGAKSEFNGRTNMGLLENGLELGFFRLLLERYVVDVFRSAGHNQVFTSCLPLQLTSDLRQVMKIPLILMPW